MTSFTKGTVETEGCPINYWYTGTGPLVIFIPGGNGHGRQYYALLPLLSTNYTVATYDRRQMSSSLPRDPKSYNMFNPAQQARDALAVMRSIGFEKTAIFGSSLGGIIAFQLAVSYPEFLTAVVAHEAPTFSLLPDSTYWLDWCFNVVEAYRKSGIEAAEKAFGPIMVGTEGGKGTQTPERWNLENFYAHECLTASSYCPDLARIRERGTPPVAVGYGVASLDAAYARATVEQARVLGCGRVRFEGHHQNFETMPAVFAPVLRRVLDGLMGLEKGGEE